MFHRKKQKRFVLDPGSVLLEVAWDILAPRLPARVQPGCYAGLCAWPFAFSAPQPCVRPHPSCSALGRSVTTCGTGRLQGDCLLRSFSSVGCADVIGCPSRRRRACPPSCRPGSSSFVCVVLTQPRVLPEDSLSLYCRGFFVPELDVFLMKACRPFLALRPTRLTGLWGFLRSAVCSASAEGSRASYTPVYPCVFSSSSSVFLVPWQELLSSLDYFSKKKNI